MKTIKTIAIVFILATLAASANSLLDYFKAWSEGNSVVIEWKCGNELSVSRYELQRSSDGSSYTAVETFYTKGSGSVYKHTDEDVFFKGGSNEVQSDTRYYYRVKIINVDNSFVYSSTVSVSPNISSIRRTWGMIKEMFR